MSSSIIPVSPVQPEEIVRQLRAIRDQIPDFTQIPAPETRSLARAATIDGDFIQASINAVGASDALRNALGRSAEELRQDTEFTARWGSVVDELQALLAGVRSAVRVRRHRIGVTALQAYQVSRQLARQKEHADLLPHIDSMRRRNKFGRKRSRVPVEPEAVPKEPVLS